MGVHHSFFPSSSFPVAISEQFCPEDCAQVMTTNPKPNKALKVRGVLLRLLYKRIGQIKANLQTQGQYTAEEAMLERDGRVWPFP